MANTRSSARPYARAIYLLAKQGDNFSAWGQALSFLSTITADSNIAQLLNDPCVNSSTFYKLLTQVLSDFLPEDQADLKQQISNFIALLIEAKRLNVLNDISYLYNHMLADKDGVLTAKLISADTVTEQKQQQLKLALEKRFKRSINLEVDIDKSHIGGLVIRVGNIVMDSTLRTKLDCLKEVLL